MLRLDKRVLEGLRTWSAKEVGAGVTQEEIDLAEKLYEDFSRFPIQETEPSAPAESALLLENPTTGKPLQPPYPVVARVMSRLTFVMIRVYSCVAGQPSGAWQP